MFLTTTYLGVAKQALLRKLLLDEMAALKAKMEELLC